MPDKPTAILAGACGRSGEALLNALLASGRYGQVRLLCRQEMASSDHKLACWTVPYDLDASALQRHPPPAAADGYVLALGERLHSARDEAQHTVGRDALLPLAQALADAGVRRLFLVCPIAAQDQLTQMRGFLLGSELTLALTRLPLRRLDLILPSDAAQTAETGWRRWQQIYLSAFRLMLPSNTAPLTPLRLAEAVLRIAKAEGSGVRVHGAQELHALLAADSP